MIHRCQGKDNIITRLNGALQGCESIIELGCGHGSVINGINRSGKRVVGVDIFEPYLQIARRRYPRVEFVHLDVRQVRSRWEPKSFDAVVLFDIIEHLERTDSERLLQDAEELANKCIVIFVPVGLHPQDREPDKLYAERRGGERNDYWQTHRSTWEPNELEALGYEVWHYPRYHLRKENPAAMFCLKRCS
jgi:cyclopropane fatty-acyl-phospholipid synthase-like methyltransferase